MYTESKHDDGADRAQARPRPARTGLSYLIAGGLAVAVVVWMLSGQWSTGPVARVPVATGPSEPKLMSVRVRDIRPAPVERAIVINGRTEPARTVDLRAEIGGRVIALGAPRGALVQAGDMLVEIDPRALAARVEEAGAMLKMREIENEAAVQLGAKGFQATTKVAEAKAELEAAQAALEQAEIDLSHTRIVAPFAGVAERPVELGDFVSEGDEVASVIELDPLLITGEVTETRIGGLTVGMPGTARLTTGQVVEGRVSYIGRQADPATRTFPIELEVDNPGSRLAAGVSAELRIVWQEVEAHRVSPTLLSLDDAGRVGIKAVDENDVVLFYPARIVRAEADAVWLTDLPDELRVITVGQGFVRAGDRVRSTLEAEPEVSEPSGEPRA